jgi:hypothetical protein
MNFRVPSIQTAKHLALPGILITTCVTCLLLARGFQHAYDYSAFDEPFARLKARFDSLPGLHVHPDELPDTARPR